MQPELSRDQIVAFNSLRNTQSSTRFFEEEKINKENFEKKKETCNLLKITSKLQFSHIIGKEKETKTQQKRISLDIKRILCFCFT